jgi:hypothetical protein
VFDEMDSVDLGIPDISPPPTPTLDIKTVEQSTDTIESLDPTILARAVSVGRTVIHTKSYLMVRDHINNLINPVKIPQDFTELLKTINTQPKKQRKTLAPAPKKLLIDEDEDDDELEYDSDNSAMRSVDGIEEESDVDDIINDDEDEEEEDSGFSPVVCDTCGNSSSGSSYNSIKDVDGHNVNINCCSSKCFAKNKF